MPAALTREMLLAELRDHHFSGSAGSASPRFGAEAEAIPVLSASGTPAPIVSAGARPATLPLLRRFGQGRGWREEPTPYGVPRFVIDGAGTVSYEPGGQIEFSALPAASVGALVGTLRGVMAPLRDFFADEGITLLSAGIAPTGVVDDVPLQIRGGRYFAMTQFLDAIGTGGARMMRQTAAFQVNLDWGGDPFARWRLLNAMAPLLTAIFASSPRYQGRDTGEQSIRARVWRELDGGRTGIFPGDAPVDEYLDFALRAPAIFHDDADGKYPSFAAWNGEGAATLADWHAHLTTLFPEIRPKGYAEVRSIDAVAPEWYAAPLVLLVGATHDAAAARAATDLLGAPNTTLLERAGRVGVHDAEIARLAVDLWEIALAGAARLPALVEDEMRAEAQRFFDTYTRCGRAPADHIRRSH